MKITAADKKWRAEVIKKYGDFCEYCHSISNLNVHHIFSRRIKCIRHYFPNGCVLCAKHHLFSTEFSAHQTPLAFAVWIIKRRGQLWYNNLEKKRNE